ncbi:FAST kinase domain-containing protein 3, mitochondrial-like [Mugil cephalus]|uniref:FAST kinase domain-containing protein 3, mitochondrial-like n=1 Tax=Mugil cephalus TaxID=48193 RepID=UPI001FB638D8|nr:FAST kinase domain-containing protein 3, mitochondrial-like [Mugil cephalus]XP_047455944.1 FAST kinase domain-containing protein 3, mitochondrial-like [Mugil cephalus]
MKSLVCISSSVRAACQHASACFTLNRGLILCNSVGRCPNASKTIVVQPRVTGMRCIQTTRGAAVQLASAGPLHTPVPMPGKRLDEVTTYHTGTLLKPARAAPKISPYAPYSNPRSNAAARVNIQSLFDEDVVPELCSRLAGYPSNDRAEGLAILLGACVEVGLEAHSPPAFRLMNECVELLSSRDVGVAQLCLLGKVACALEGPQSCVVKEVLDCIDVAVEEGGVSPCDAATVYSLLTLIYEPDNLQQRLILSALHRRTQRLIHRLTASQVIDILQSLVKLQQRQAILLVLRLSHRASRVFKALSDDEIIKLLSALMTLGQHDNELLAAMEKYLPARLGECDPELNSTIMEYCLQMRCRSEPVFEAVAENFAFNGEKHTTLQIAKQIVAMGRLNYLPQCSSQMFKKLESILSTRFSEFQPRSLIDMLHACIHLERFPLNYIHKIFSPHFLQKIHAQKEPMDKNTLGQLTQLHLSTTLECKHYGGPKLPFFPYLKRFSSMDQAFETPMENLMYKQVKGPLIQLLGGKLFSTRTSAHIGYTIDVEICLDEDGFVLPLSEWEHISKRIALCLDGQNRFCSNTHNLLGKEATKRRHLRSIGYEVVQIPYFEFEKLRTSKEQVQYLQDKIFPTITKLSHQS